jgi:hypothetical protein
MADRSEVSREAIITRLSKQLEQSRQQEQLLKDTLTRLLEIHKAQPPS